MKIDRIYVVCNRKDLYLTKICIASIRYWNKEIAVSLIRDYSNGQFDTTELEQTMNVSVPAMPFSNLSYYSKLFPFIEANADERIMILDSDIVWMCDMIGLLEQYNEDIIVDGYDPKDLKEEMNRWYFRLPEFTEKYCNYQYPGFLFNVGQMVCNSSVFRKEDFSSLLNWKENPSPVTNAFFYEQGMLNYLVAEKIKRKEISYKLVRFHRWGWDEELKQLNASAITSKQSYPYLIHWYGKKNGLISFLPCSAVLKFYEAYYFSFVRNGKSKMRSERFNRSISNPGSLLYESMKWIYLSLTKKR